MKFRMTRTACVLLAAASLAGGLAGRFPLVVGGVAGGSVVAGDRRTAGPQVEGAGIECRALNRIHAEPGDRGHINFTSYNRQLLLTGEVPSEEVRQSVERSAGAVGNVRSVVNDLAVMPKTSLMQRSGDTFITGKVRASLMDAKDISASAFKVVTERNVVYLMGLVTEREATRATAIARGVDGVRKVVRVFEILTEDQLVRLSAPRPTAAPAPVTRDTAPASPTQPSLPAQ